MQRALLPIRVLMGCLLLFVGTSAQPQSQNVIGTYVLDPTASDDINAAIDAATAHMNFVVKAFARSRLKKTNPPYHRIVIAREGSDVVVTFDERKPIRMPADGTPAKWTREDGEKFEIKADYADSKLVQSFVAEDGKRINEFGVGSDAAKMTLNVTIISERLEKPMTYKLGYHRFNA